MHLKDNIVKKYGKTRLTTAIVYEIENQTEVDKKIIDLVSNVEQFINTKYNVSYNLTTLINSLLCIYHSNTTINNLPSMTDSILNGSKPNLHIVFGETISQLVSVSLLTESLFYINELIINNKVNVETRIKMMDVYINYTPQLDNVLENKELLKLTIDKNINVLLMKALDLSIMVYGNLVNQSDTLIIQNYFSFKFNLQ
uniref:Uncharacterized protein n=1 Tax=viral metagenome TaxID=1070528 RepID=A0A6C0EKZ0_9ZZZZ